MTRNVNYNTKQKDMIMNVLKNTKKEFTIKEIYENVSDIGLTTIYRLVDKLVEEDRIKKTIGSDKQTYYQYLEDCSEENHFYLKCNKCGTLIHVDCDCLGDLLSHISKEHNFSASNKNIILNGICEKCK